MLPKYPLKPLARIAIILFYAILLNQSFGRNYTDEVEPTGYLSLPKSTDLITSNWHREKGSLEKNMPVLTTLLAGDIAFSSFNTDGNDEFSFVLLKDITGTTTIHFTDDGFNDNTNNLIGGAEGTVTWTYMGSLSAGTEISILLPKDSNTSGTSTVGGVATGSTSETGSFSLSSSGDSIIAYVGTLGSPTTYIAAVYIGGNGFTASATTSIASSVPSGLSLASKTAIQSNSTNDNYIFDCTKGDITTVSTLRTALNTSSNFNSFTATGDVQSAPGCSFLSGGSDTDAPTFDVSPATSSKTTSGFTVGASIDEGGDIYYVVLTNGATAPTSANVIAGTGNGGASAEASGNGTGLTDPFTLSSAVTGLTAGTAYDVYVVARDDESTPNVQTSPTKVDVSTLAPSSLQVAATVFLEGAWNGSNAMNTTLEDADLVSASAPYNGTNSHAGSESVANTAAVPDGAVDWVLVELRESGSAAGATNTTRKGSAAGFLMSDGTIKAIDGSSNLTINLSGNTGTDYYVVIYHRNHLPIMSANAVAGSSGTLTIDFTANSSNTYQTTTALVSLAGSKFGMPAGDSNGDGNINTTDLGTWRTNNGVAYNYSGSGIADFNLDGEINAVDRNDFQQKNTSKSRQVPSN